MNAPIRLNHTIKLADLSDPHVSQQIDGFVREQGGSIFHLSNWVKGVASGTGQIAGGFIAEQFGVITGWLPFTHVRSLMFGNALVSSGFGVGGGILAETDEIVASLAQAAQDYAAKSGFGSIELRGGPIPDDWTWWDDKHCGFERSLEQDDEAELLAIPRKARAEVRKGLENNLEVRVGCDANDLAAHYKVYSESVRNLGTPVFPRSLFKAMLAAFPDHCDILTVSKAGIPVSSVMSFYHNEAVLPFWGGGTLAARGLRANELMYYKLMLHARNKGMERFDFGRSKTGSGPYKFKKNWGFEPVALRYGMWTGVQAETRNIDPTNEAYSRKIELWKKLPLPIANMIGPWIARGLA